MHEKQFDRVHCVGKTIPFAVLALVTIFAVPKASSQSTAFAPVPVRSKYTVSLRDLHIPSKAKDNYQRGLRRLIKNDAQGSLKHFAEAIAAAPQFYDAYYHRGVAEALLNRNEEALHSFQAAIDLSEGRDPRSEFGYALVLSRIGNVAEAERIVRHGLQTDSNIPDGHVVLGLILLKMNRIDDAEKSAQEALLLGQPSSAKAHLILADVRGARQDFAGQVSELNEYLDAYPKDPNQKFLKAIRDTAERLAARKRN
jgi:tetratricopeptide (TPR) repeat protein